jgi:hypothetical protein
VANQPTNGNPEALYPRAVHPKISSMHTGMVLAFAQEDLHMTKPLLLAFALLIPLGLFAQNASVPRPAQTERNLMAANSNAAELAPLKAVQGSGEADPGAGSSDDICYRIRAYIFKRDDDHPPKLIGSTTCGPRQPTARNAVSPQVHFELLK